VRQPYPTASSLQRSSWTTICACHENGSNCDGLFPRVEAAITSLGAILPAHLIFSFHEASEAATCSSLRRSKPRPVENTFPGCSLEGGGTRRALLVSCVISLAQHPLTGSAVHRDPSVFCSPVASCSTATASTNRVHGWVRAGTATSQTGQPCAYCVYTARRQPEGHVHVHLRPGGGSGIVCTAHVRPVGAFLEVQAARDARLPPPGTSCKMESMDGAGSTSKIYFPESAAIIQNDDGVGVEVVLRSSGVVVTAADGIGLGCRVALGPPSLHKYGRSAPKTGLGRAECMGSGPASSPPELCCRDRGRKHAADQHSREVEFSCAKFFFPSTRRWLRIEYRLHERLLGTGVVCSETSTVGRQNVCLDR
jgi:hypothetical protein